MKHSARTAHSVAFAFTGLLLGTCAPGGKPRNTSALAVVKAVAPVFPDVALQGQVSGSLSLEVTVDPQGKVVDTRTLGGDRLFRDMSASSRRTASQWVFTPGEAPERTVRLEFVFQVVPRDAPVEDCGAIFKPPYGVVVRAKPAIVDVEPRRDPKGEVVP